MSTTKTKKTKEEKKEVGHRVSENGSFVVDRVIPGVGRLRMATGITRPAQWTLFKAALDEMIRDVVWHDALRSVIARDYTPLQLWAAFKSKEGHRSLDLDAKTKNSLITAMKQWLVDQVDNVAESTTLGRRNTVAAIEKHPASKHATVRDLPKVVLAMRTMRSGIGFNQHRTYCLAFCRDTLTKRHEVYHGVIAVESRPEKRVKVDGVVTVLERRPLTPHEVVALANAFNRHTQPKKGKRSNELIAMCLTGCNPKEYFDSTFTVYQKGNALIKAPHVHIEGTKQDGRVRDIPMTFPNPLWPHDTLVPAAITQKPFALALKIAAGITGIPLTPYDCRRTFANWMESAGILRTHREIYMGHGARTMTDLYERHQVAAFLKEDGEKLRNWITAELKKPAEQEEVADSSPGLSPGQLRLA